MRWRSNVLLRLEVGAIACFGVLIAACSRQAAFTGEALLGTLPYPLPPNRLG
ncbi:MAG: hypothetical protein HY700_05810 [Gemmatimonadetes bacterium]|nr:hypothetical protein [Gemmatimonadota bacterium]